MRRRLSTWDTTIDENTPAVLNEKETEHMGPHYRWKHTCCTQWEGDWAHGTPLSMKTHLVYSMRRRLSTWDPTLDENTPAVLNEKETEHMGPHYRWKHTWCTQWEGDWAHGTPLSMKTHLVWSMRRGLSTWDPTIDENTPGVLNEKETEHMGPHYRWKHTCCTQWEGDWAHGTPLSMKTHLMYSMRRRLSTWDPTLDENTPGVLNEKETEHMGPHYRWKHTWCTQWEGDWAHGTPLSMKTHLVYSMRRRLSTWDPTIDENTPGVLNEKETEHMGPHYRWKHTWCTQWEGDWAHGTPLSMKTHLVYSMRRRLSTWDPTIDENTPGATNGESSLSVCRWMKTLLMQNLFPNLIWGLKNCSKGREDPKNEQNSWPSTKQVRGGGGEGGQKKICTRSFARDAWQWFWRYWKYAEHKIQNAYHINTHEDEGNVVPVCIGRDKTVSIS